MWNLLCDFVFYFIDFNNCSVLRLGHSKNLNIKNGYALQLNNILWLTALSTILTNQLYQNNSKVTQVLA